MTFNELFTATQLALGPSPKNEASDAMTKYQIDLLIFWADAGVKKLDDRENRCMLLGWYFLWEASYIPESKRLTPTPGP